MPSADGGDWIDRVSRSMRDHESTRRMTRPPIPRYEILEELNRGGMGIVYRAWDPQLGREVALKVLLDPGGAPAEARARFLQEAQLAARLVHPHIVPVYDTGEHEDQVFLAMQLIDGTGLDKAKLDLRAAVGVLRDAARAVQYAHEQGVIHRDLKPSNLMVDRKGRVFVTDFGLARRSDASAKLTLSGTVLGTPAYMPPEQARGMPTDARSDVYALGATMYEVLSGRAPFSGPNEMEVLKHVLLDEPPFPRRHNRAIPRDVEAVILKAMDKKASGRYATAGALADDLQRFLDGEPVRAPTRGLFYRTRKKVVRHRWRILAAASLLGLLAAGVVTGWSYLDAREKHRRAMQEPDPSLRKELLQAASGWISAARRELRRIEGEELEAKRKRDSEIKEMKARDQDRAQLEAAEQACDAAIDSRDLEGARRALEALRKLDPKAVERFQMPLRSLEFDQGVEGLRRLAEGEEAEAFRALFNLLSEERYRSQVERNRRLGLPCLARARALLGRSRFGDAIPWFDKAESLGLQDWRLYQERGLARVSLQQWDSALADYARFDQDAPSATLRPPAFAGIWIHQAEQAGNPAEALTHLAKAIELDGKNARALHLRGLARYRASLPPQEALDDLERALAHEPGLVPDREYAKVALAWAGKVVADSRDLEDAKARETAWTEAVRRLSVLASSLATLDRPGVLLERARMHRRLGKPAKALEDAKDAGESPESFLIRAQIRTLEGRFEEARQCADRAATEEPRNHRAKYWRGTCAALAGKPGAAEDLRAACESPEFGAEPLHRLARLSLDLKDWKGAAAWGAQALARAGPLTEDERIVLFGDPPAIPPSAGAARFRRDVHTTIAQARFNLEDFAGCEEHCTRAIDPGPPSAGAFFLRGYARYKLKRYPDAIGDFTQELKLNPKDVEALLGRATARTYAKNYDEAIQDYDEALGLQPRSAEALAGRGAAKEAKGNKEGAILDYEKALAEGGSNWVHRQAISEKLRRLKE